MVLQYNGVRYALIKSYSNWACCLAYLHIIANVKYNDKYKFNLFYTFTINVQYNKILH